MNLDFDQIPTIESARRLGRRGAAESAIEEAYRYEGRDPARLNSLGLGLGLEAVQFLEKKMFPSGTFFSALQGPNPTYTMHLDCGGFSYGGDCEEACFGFEPHMMDSFFCATCDEQAADPTNNPVYNWHFVGNRGEIQYQDVEPDICAGRDAWKWKVGACGDCAESAVFRCHDGYKKLPGETQWENTICQGLVSCDDELTPCP